MKPSPSMEIVEQLERLGIELSELEKLLSGRLQETLQQNISEVESAKHKHKVNFV